MPTLCGVRACAGIWPDEEWNDSAWGAMCSNFAVDPTQGFPLPQFVKFAQFMDDAGSNDTHGGAQSAQGAQDGAHQSALLEEDTASSHSSEDDFIERSAGHVGQRVQSRPHAAPAAATTSTATVPQRSTVDFAAKFQQASLESQRTREDPVSLHTTHAQAEAGVGLSVLPGGAGGSLRQGRRTGSLPRAPSKWKKQTVSVRGQASSRADHGSAETEMPASASAEAVPADATEQLEEI